MAALASCDMSRGYHRHVESKSCPCGSGVPERACCARYHAGELAPTALALMRSRYTAYVRGEIDYLLRTHDASTRDAVDVRAVKKWSKTTLWLGLEIVAASEAGDTGIVEFIARGSTAGKAFAQRERSRFRRVEGTWFYLDGEG
jgi:SEC-C motif domain protein